MDSDSKKTQVFEALIRAYNPSQIVILEASALDRELQVSPKSWPVLAAAVRSFIENYPAVLAHSPKALALMGGRCIEGTREAAGRKAREEFSSLLVTMIYRVLGEMLREKKERLPDQVLSVLLSLLQRIASESVPVEIRHLVPILQQMGIRILMVIEDVQPSALWQKLLAAVTFLLLLNHRRMLLEQLSYDGRWDGSPFQKILMTDKLDLVRPERIAVEMRFNEAQRNKMQSGLSSVGDVFLECNSFDRGSSGSDSWKQWFSALGDNVRSIGASRGASRELFLSVSEWIHKTRELALLEMMAEFLTTLLSVVVERQNDTALEVGLNRLVPSLAQRLDREMGYGHIEKPFAMFRRVAADLLERKFMSPSLNDARDHLEKVVQLRTGPIEGMPFSVDDVSWNMRLAVKCPITAKKVMLSLITGYSLEEGLLVRNLTEQTPSLLPVLADWLTISWRKELDFLARAVVRLTPISPFGLIGKASHAHLVGLDPLDKEGTVMHDIKKRIVFGSARQNIRCLEALLSFWITGNAKILQGWISPESYYDIEQEEQRHIRRQIQQLLDRLAKHVSGFKQGEIQWLANMPETFYFRSTLTKIAGFKECQPYALDLLSHVLGLYRSFWEGMAPQVSKRPLIDLSTKELFEQSDTLLRQRNEMKKKLVGVDVEPDRTDEQKIDLFVQELTLQKKENVVLDELLGRRTWEQDLAQAEMLLGHLVRQARMSGIKAIEKIPRISTRSRWNENRILMMEKLVGYKQQLQRDFHPYVEMSVGRLKANSLARPVNSYRLWWQAHANKDARSLTGPLSQLLVCDLVSIDGGLNKLEQLLTEEL